MRKRTVKMIARYPGTCTECKGKVLPGEAIYWTPAIGARHVDCQAAAYAASGCTACKGGGRSWRNAPCPMCDGTGSRTVQEYAKERAAAQAARDVASAPLVETPAEWLARQPGLVALPGIAKRAGAFPLAEDKPDPMGVDAAYEDACAAQCGL
jgi:hypothetical protein